MADPTENSTNIYAVSDRVVLGVAVVVIPVMLAVAGWTSQEFPNRVDRYLFEQMGETVLDGGTVYLDCWDNKPPGLCWLSALVLWMGGRSTYAITAAAVIAGALAVGATGWAIARATRRAVATLTVLLFAIVLSQRQFDACTNGTEFYTMVADAFAALFVVAALRGAGGRSLLYALLAGVCWGLGGLCKQTAAAGPIAVVLGVLIAVLVGVRPRTRWLGRALLAGLGALIVLAAAAGVLYYQGALGEACRAVISINLLPQNRTHTTGAFHPGYVLAQLEPVKGVILLAAVGAVVSFVHKPSGEEATLPVHHGERVLPRSVVVFMILWCLVAVYGVGIGPSHMPRYWHGLFVPLIWLTAQGVAFVLTTCGSGDRHRRVTAGIGALTLAVIFFQPLVTNIYRDAFQAHHYAKADSERVRLIEVGERIRALTEPGDRIYVWGYSPGIYRFASRASACRFSGLEKLDGQTTFGQSMAEEIFETLRDEPPELIAVEQSRYSALLEDRIGSVTLPGLSEWMSNNYRQQDALHGLRLFVRASPQTTQARLVPAKPVVPPV
jgi:hypothetical protein